MFDRNESIEITKKLLIAIGMELQPNTNVLVDQDTKSPISFDGKIIKANNDVNKSLYVSEYDVKLDPLDPKCTKIIERLFGKFLDDNSSEDMQNIPEVLTYFFDKDDDNHLYRLEIKFSNGDKWIGNWFKNKILCYLESIFLINGTFDDIDLTIYDIDQDDEGNNE